MSKNARHFGIACIRNLLLLVLLWSQMSVAMPEIHDHEEGGEAVTHAEIGDHVMVIPGSEHEHEDGSQHELHVHACGGHVAAMPVFLEVPALVRQPSLVIQHQLHFSFRTPERLLRPPIV